SVGGTLHGCFGGRGLRARRRLRERQRERERAPLAGAAARLDQAAVEPQDVADDREAQAGTGLALPSHAVEPVEHLLEIALRDPDPGVAHLDQREAGLPAPDV